LRKRHILNFNTIFIQNDGSQLNDFVPLPTPSCCYLKVYLIVGNQKNVPETTKNDLKLPFVLKNGNVLHTVYKKSHPKTVTFVPLPHADLAFWQYRCNTHDILWEAPIHKKVQDAKVSGSNSLAVKRKGCRYASTKKHKQKTSHFVPLPHADLEFRQYWCNTHDIL
jgi:hypothetical protein